MDPILKENKGKDKIILYISYFYVRNIMVVTLS